MTKVVGIRHNDVFTRRESLPLTPDAGVVRRWVCGGCGEALTVALPTDKATVVHKAARAAKDCRWHRGLL